jgi:hypothetical protein
MSMACIACVVLSSSAMPVQQWEQCIAWCALARQEAAACRGMAHIAIANIPATNLARYFMLGAILLLSPGKCHWLRQPVGQAAIVAPALHRNDLVSKIEAK